VSTPYVSLKKKDNQREEIIEYDQQTMKRRGEGYMQGEAFNNEKQKERIKEERNGGGGTHTGCKPLKGKGGVRGKI